MVGPTLGGRSEPGGTGSIPSSRELCFSIQTEGNVKFGEPCWGRFGMVWGSVWGDVGIFVFVMLGSFGNMFGIVLESFWNNFWIVLESFWNHVGISLELVWDNLWARFGQFFSSGVPPHHHHSYPLKAGWPFIPALWYHPPRPSLLSADAGP